MTSELILQVGSLQSRQLEHDQLAHKQVLGWTFQKRVTHFTLHFAKYQATLLTADDTDGGSATKRRVLCDSLIIALAAANTLDIRLADRASSFLRHTLLSGRNENRTKADVLGSYIAAVGRMAKACEAMDHGEEFDYCGVLETAVVALVSATAGLAELEEIDLSALVHQRWRDIEVSANAGQAAEYQQRGRPAARTESAKYA